MVLVISVSTLNFAYSSEYKMLLLGDSWVQAMYQMKSFQQVFEQHGYPDFKIKGDKTAIGGTTAAFWAKPEKLDIISTELKDNPSIKYVQIFLGGNDILSGKLRKGWHTKLSEQDAVLLYDKIAANMAKIVNCCLNNRPDVKVVISGYDYLNFEYANSIDPNGPSCLLWQNLGCPHPAEINKVFYSLEQKIIALSEENPRLIYVSNFGLMQYNFEGINKDSNDVYSPPGDINLPCPPTLLNGNGRDSIHLNPKGYLLVAENLFNKFYASDFRKGGTK